MKLSNTTIRVRWPFRNLLDDDFAHWPAVNWKTVRGEMRSVPYVPKRNDRSSTGFVRFNPIDFSYSGGKNTYRFDMQRRAGVTPVPPVGSAVHWSSQLNNLRYYGRKPSHEPSRDTWNGLGEEKGLWAILTKFEESDFGREVLFEFELCESKEQAMSWAYFFVAYHFDQRNLRDIIRRQGTDYVRVMLDKVSEEMDYA